MPQINLAPFSGYSTKPDAVLDDPRIAADCNNIIIHNGDICNFPYLKKYYNSNRFAEANTHILGIYYDNKYKKQILFILDGLSRIHVTKLTAVNTLLDFLEIFNTDAAFFRLSLGIRYPFILEAPDSRATLLPAMSSNWIQVGTWMFLLGAYGPTELRITTGLLGSYLPRINMYKFKYVPNPDNPDDLESATLIGEKIGLYAPSRVEIGLTGSTPDFTGSYDFAFTFVRGEFTQKSGRNIPTFDTDESSAIVYGTLSDIQAAAPRVVLFAPLGNENLDYLTGSSTHHRGTFKMGVYARSSVQSIYYLIGYTTQTISNVTFDGIYSAHKGIFTLTIALLFPDITPVPTTIEQLQELHGFKPAPLTGITPIQGAHDVPRLCYHGAYFKNRMYYTSSPQPKNLLQYSARTPVTDVETGQFAQYIEGIEQVGDESEGLSGLIVFQGQLIIFRETTTWVLTDDISTTGSLRPLLSDVGCVNIDGGQGYIVINNVLYFVSRDGIIKYDGGSQENISDMIQEDLLKISRIRYSYVRLRHDSRYNLLLVCFPLGKDCNPIEVVPTFVYSYDSQQWTKIDHIDDAIIDKKSTEDPTQQINMWVARNDRLALLGLITDDEVFTELTKDWFWKSSLLDLGHGGLIKHWSILYLETVPSTVYMRSEYFDGEKNQIGDTRSSTAIGAMDEKIRNIGAHSRALSVKLSSILLPSLPPGTPDDLSFYKQIRKKPFRINRAKIEALTTGIY